MQTGTKISAAAHATLIGVALFGGAFRSEPLPFEVQEVAIISGEQFAAMTAPRQAPEIVTETETPDAPEPEEQAARPEPDAPEPEQAPPEVVPEPEPDPAPEVAIQTPEPEVIEDTPTPEPPEPEVVVLPAPPGDRAEPRPVDRVAPQPVAPPPPDATPDDIEQEAVIAQEGETETPRDEQEAKAPDEANDRIVTEAEETKELAPERSPRPAARPSRPEPPVETAQEPAKEETPKPSGQEEAVENALKDILGGEAATEAAAPAPTGPPLTSGEKESLRVAVSNCWNVGSLSTEALGTTVIVGVTMNQDGTPVRESVRLLDSSGGSNAAARQAYEAARRAIIRCGAKGFDLPADKYGQWRDIEMTFNPERMRIK